MNNKGQTLVMFVVMVPIIIILMAFVVDTGIILKEHTKLNSTTKSVLKSTYNDRLDTNYLEKINDLFSKNNIPTDNLIIEIKNDEIRITNEYEKDSIFGKIIGLKEYKIKNSLKIKKENDKLIITKE